MLRSLLVLAMSLGAALSVAEDNWPQFRGPHGDGHSDATGLPMSWSETENVAWKTSIHDHGWSSPVVWGEQVWVTTATEDGKQLFAVCLDRETGKIVHDIKVFDVEKPEHIAAVNSYASPTPVIEAGRIYVHYGTYGTACLDTQTGKILWTRRDLNCDHHEGPGSSPMLFGEVLIVHVDGRDTQYVIALDKTTGKTAWKTNRSIDYSVYEANYHKAFCTPIVIEADGRRQLISPAAKGVMSYDPATGEELWKVRYNGWSVTPRPLFGHGLIYLVNDYEKPELWAVRPGGRGDLTESNVVWKIQKGVGSAPSHLLVGDLLYLVTDLGVAMAIEAKTGEIVWRERLGGNFAASPIYADGKLWFFSQEAVTTVLEPGRQFKTLAVNRLEEQLKASPAMAGKALFVRTQTHVYRIEQQSAAVTSASGAGDAVATKPTAAEMAAARRWSAAKFEAQPLGQEPGLFVLANHDSVLKNTRGAGRPLTIGKAAYTRGLYCHANSKVVVRLPGPGKAFTATVGVDSNDQTSGGRGSVVFSVTVGEKQAFRSEVLHEGMAGAPVTVDLDGATEFVLEVGEAGDGISCDQSDWAEAKVVLKDGTALWLGELPFAEEIAAVTTAPPFSFVYGGESSTELLKKWTVERASRKLDAQQTEHTIVYRDPGTGLVVRCVAIEYHDFPTVEWTLYFKNTGEADTPLLTDIRAIDTRFHRNKDDEFVLHHSTGSPCAPNDYEPHVTPLGPKAVRRIATNGGRSTNSDMPYFNLQWPGQGVIVVLGWPGQWAADFSRDEGTGVSVRGGQETTRFKLHPGEEVRSPLAVVQFWKGEWIRSQNIWRRWMVAHNLPRPGGKRMPTAIMNCTSDFYPGMKSNAADEVKYIAAFANAGVKLDYWWIDAGWYPCGNEWPNIGTWDPDPQRYPKGLKEVSDFAHSKDMKLVVWFEPERVVRGTWLAENHPKWIVGGGEGGLLNLGNTEAMQWLIEHVDKLITEEGIDLYREDHNFDPLGAWNANDTPDRQGITEIRHVTGHLAYWDELRRRHPDMPIDTCASGGRRNDLESLRRAFPLLRSDYRAEPAGTQGHTYGMALWIPYYGTGVGAESDYVVRSHWCPWLGIGQPDPLKPDQDWTKYHRMVAELRKVADYFYGDYYPLTSYSLENSAWMAWQFDLPETGEGMVQVFRRAESPYESARFPLRGLDLAAKYIVTDMDSNKSQEMTGRELSGLGLKVDADKRPSAIVLLYKKLK